MSLSGNELRREFLRYFESLPGAGHKIVAPAPLIPPDDPTLLFTSAGMVQFKSLYSGDIDPLPYSRAASCQPCLRAGGKGSDLENVGKTLRHHTLFEMLGNFSFGDYFKREAIRWGWQFVTETMGLPKERLFPTIFEQDDEAEQLWREETDCQYTPVRLDAKQNFWGPAGDTGACGPCSELCFFMGGDEELAALRADYAKSESAMLPILARRIDEEGDLFLEIWNMVFPQFDQQRDGSRLPLKNRGIDTGAGLERMTTAMMWLRGEASSPYETDLLQPIVQAAAGLLGVTYHKVLDPNGQTEDARRVRLALNAISDHARALSFCLAEGITPGNVGRGYVIRRIQRRALRFSSLLGKDEPFMAALVDPVIEAMGGAYPQLKAKADFIRKAMRIEEESFLRTRNRGTRLLEELIDQAKDRGDLAIPGAEAFKLWDTYGFPLDLTREIADDAGVSIDQAGYDSALKEQRERGVASWRGEALNREAQLLEPLADKHGATPFKGYDPAVPPLAAKVLALVVDGVLVDRLATGTTAVVVLDQTSFYAESGGQIGDTGFICTAEGAQFEVLDTQKTPQGIVLHRGELQEGELATGEKVTAQVNRERRMAIRRNHSSVHLLQAALKNHVGDHVAQAGSFVGPDYARFDFSHPEQLSADVLRKLQDDVNHMILADYEVKTEVLPLEEARAKGAIAPFGEKYGPTVRVVSMGNAEKTPSIEFCGGTHLDRTGQAARFRILSEGSIASGVRRIEFTAGEPALKADLEDQYGVLKPLEAKLAVRGHAMIDRVAQLAARVKQLEKELARERSQALLSNVAAFAAKALDLGQGARLATALVEDVAANDLRAFAVAIQETLGPKGIAVAVSKGEEDKVSIVAAVGADVRGSYPAGKVVNAIAAPLGGKGGGKPDVAQAGAKGASNVEQVLAQAKELIEQIHAAAG
jgi:alanyl-tRNA synthetase